MRTHEYGLFSLYIEVLNVADSSLNFFAYSIQLSSTLSSLLVISGHPPALRFLAARTSDLTSLIILTSTIALKELHLKIASLYSVDGFLLLDMS